MLGEYEEHERTPSYAQSCKMHKLADAGELDHKVIHELMAQEKPNQREAIKIACTKIKGRIPNRTRTGRPRNSSSGRWTITACTSENNAIPNDEVCAFD